MNTENGGPQTLLEAVTYFADPDVALRFVATLRWPDGVICADCGSENIHFMEKRRIWKCRDCKRQFSAKVGTIFEDSPVSLSKWLPAMWLIVNCKNGISSYELARAIKVTQKTAWFMLHRIRLAMQSDNFDRMGGAVEVDETFIGGKARNMHKAKLERMRMEGAHVGKVSVVGILRRNENEPRKNSTVRLKVVGDVCRPTLQRYIRKNVKDGVALYTDALESYRGLREDYWHMTINHAKQYVRAHVHNNGIENFWSLLKRTIRGTYVSIEPFHTFRYLDEQAYLFNHREETDTGRFLRAARVSSASV